MGEIFNIKEQLEQIVTRLGIPISSGGSFDDYLCCVAAGMIQFVCVRNGKDNYRSLTEDYIRIHPGSSMFRANPLYIVAGEIVRTSRMFAMSVSPLTKSLLERIDPSLLKTLTAQESRSHGKTRTNTRGAPAAAGGTSTTTSRGKPKNENGINFCGEFFSFEKNKGKNRLLLPLDRLSKALNAETANIKSESQKIEHFRGVVTVGGKSLLAGEKLQLIFKLAKTIDLFPVQFPEGKPIIHSGQSPQEFMKFLKLVLAVCPLRNENSTLGFIALLTDGRGNYRLKPHKGFSSALTESLSSLEMLIDDEGGLFNDEQKEAVNEVYRKLSELYD
jgi:hypothetical protein